MGFLRFVLALSVVGAHTGFSLWIGGRAAVVAFYIISGFLMAMILNNAYRNNFSAFYVNRILRIFIPAIAVFCLALLTFTVLGIHIPYLNGQGWVLFFDLVSNFFIVLQDFYWLFAVDPSANQIVWQPYGTPGTGTSLLPHQYNSPMFTVAIELYFYAIAPLIVICPKRSLIFALVGFLYHVIMKYFGLYSLGWNYHFFVASWFYFGSGIVAYWGLHKQLVEPSEKVVSVFGFEVSVLVLCYIFLAVFSVGQLWFEEFGWPIVYLICVFSVPGLLQVSKRIALDEYIGRYSYLIYLVHWPILTVVKEKTSFTAPSIAQFIIVAVASVVVSAIVHHCVEAPVDVLRKRIRDNAGSKEGSKFIQAYQYLPNLRIGRKRSGNPA